MAGLGRRRWKEAFALMGGELWCRVRSFAVLAVVGAVAYVILKLARPF